MDRNDHYDWTGGQLVEEALACRISLDTIEHCPERREQLRARLAGAAFELLCRQNENAGDDPRTVFAFSDVRWFNEYTPAKGLHLATQSIGFSA